MRAPGDTSTDTDRLSNAAAQLGKPKMVAVVGKDVGVFKLASKATATFSGTATILGSRIVVRGKVTTLPPGGYRLPVVGGTGRFAGARGTVTATNGRQRLARAERLPTDA